MRRAQLESCANDDAVLSLQRALALDAKLSRAYQLLARAQLALGRRGEALKSLRDGVTVAHQRGDQMPKNEMLAMFGELGETPPELNVARTTAVGEGDSTLLVSSIFNAKSRMSPRSRSPAARASSHHFSPERTAP